MQKKVIGIVAGVAAAHAVLLVGLMAGGGCRQPEILGPHTYNNGPEFTEIPSAVDTPSKSDKPVAPVIDTKPAVMPPVVNPPAPKVKLVAKPVSKPVAKPVLKPGKDGVAIYVVKKGDVLSRIAYNNGMRTDELAAFNNIPKDKYNKIRIGQKLRIPTGAAYTNMKRNAPKAAVKNTAAKPTDNKNLLGADGLYVVKPGDALERIGRRFGVSAKAIARENNISETKVLRIGEKLRIPAKSAQAANKAAAKPAAGQKKVTASSDDPFANVGKDADADKKDSGNLSMVDSIEVPTDTTIEEYSKQVMSTPEKLRKYNPNLPADGKIKAGTRIILPQL